MSRPTHVAAGGGEGPPPTPRGWLYDHIGRLSGIVLGLLVVGFLAFLAAVGYAPALGILIVLVIGVLLISLGGQLRGQMRGHG